MNIDPADLAETIVRMVAVDDDNFIITHDGMIGYSRLCPDGLYSGAGLLIICDDMLVRYLTITVDLCDPDSFNKLARELRRVVDSMQTDRLKYPLYPRGRKATIRREH